MRRRARAVAGFGAFVLAVLVLAGQAVPAAAVDVEGDDAVDGYLASGSLLLGPTFDGTDADRAAAAACPGCQWRLHTVCRPGELGQGETCPAAWAGCPSGSYRMRVARWSPGEPWWQWVGEVCVGPGVGPVPIDVIATEVREELLRLVPAQAPVVQPGGTTLTGLPTVVRSGQERRLGPLDLVVVGHDVVLSASATWRWEFGDGDGLTTSRPGRAWPAGDLVHVYRVGGGVTITLDTTWAGEFLVDGLGPFDVGGEPVTQRTSVGLAVREARSRLVG